MQIIGKILYNKELSPDYFRMCIGFQDVVKDIIPGQFIMLRTGETHDPLLRRPMGIHKVVGDGKGIEILYQVVGRGTSIMSAMRKGDRIDLLGPLGNGFKIDPDMKRAVIVAGGIGVAPMAALVEEIRGHGGAWGREHGAGGMGQRTKIEVFLGGKTRGDILCVDDLKGLGADVYIATEDGSLGYKGVVTDLLKERMAEKDSGFTIFSCGPNAMLKSTAEIALRYNIPCQISLDKRMACGVGACLSCVVKVKSLPPTPCYKCVCTDGPVFDAKEIAW
ncbi:MAG: dihydroorotate dehydrogenase electron transfer subunit [Nitrospinota bacterium]